MKALAKSKGGKYLSKEYINSITKMEWQCKEKHVFSISLTNIKQGRWCSICAERKQGRKDTIENMQQIAKSRGGKCLSGKYIGQKKHLLWSCKKKHKWLGAPTNIKQGTWCPVCRERKGEVVQNIMY